MSGRILTIGYGSDHFDGLSSRLTPHGVTHLVDVRTNPYSRYQEDFRGEAFAARVRASGVKYVFLGDKIGGKPTWSEVTDSDGEVDRDALRTHPTFLAGIRQLLDAVAVGDRCICLMCGCSRPETCHRGLLLSPILEESSLEVAHIRADGALESQAAAMLRLTGGQMELFGG